jgi:hypothetical protein
MKVMSSRLARNTERDSVSKKGKEFWGECRMARIHIYYHWESQIGIFLLAILEKWQCVDILNTHFFMWPINYILEIYPREWKLYFHTKITLYQIYSQLPKAGRTLMSINLWMDKGTVLHMYKGILISNKKKLLISTYTCISESQMH